MSSKPGPCRVNVLTSIVVVGAMVWTVGQRVNGQQSNFMGGTPAAVDAKAIRTTRLRFPKGSRSNWHSHSWGQLLMLEEGKGRIRTRCSSRSTKAT